MRQLASYPKAKLPAFFLGRVLIFYTVATAMLEI